LKRYGDAEPCPRLPRLWPVRLFGCTARPRPLRPAARLDRAAVVVVMSAVLFFLLGATIFSMGESKQAAVFFLVLALVAAAGVIYLRWRGQG
jgi:hypothetical protein